MAMHIRSRLLFIGRIPPDYLRKTKSRWRSWWHVKAVVGQQTVGNISKIDMETILGFSARTRQFLHLKREEAVTHTETTGDGTIAELDDSLGRLRSPLQNLSRHASHAAELPGNAMRRTEAKMSSYRRKLFRRKHVLQQQAQVIRRELEKSEDAYESVEDRDLVPSLPIIHQSQHYLQPASSQLSTQNGTHSMISDNDSFVTAFSVLPSAQPSLSAHAPTNEIPAVNDAATSVMANEAVGEAADNITEKTRLDLELNPAQYSPSPTLYPKIMEPVPVADPDPSTVHSSLTSGEGAGTCPSSGESQQARLPALGSPTRKPWISSLFSHGAANRSTVHSGIHPRHDSSSSTNAVHRSVTFSSFSRRTSAPTYPTFSRHRSNSAGGGVGISLDDVSEGSYEPSSNDEMFSDFTDAESTCTKSDDSSDAISTVLENATTDGGSESYAPEGSHAITESLGETSERDSNQIDLNELMKAGSIQDKGRGRNRFQDPLKKRAMVTVAQVDKERKALLRKIKSSKVKAPRYLKSLLNASDPRHKLELGIFHKKRGEVLFRDTFAVQVRELTDVASAKVSGNLTETDCLPTVCVDRLREYTVVARYTGNPVRPVNIYLYHSTRSKKIDVKISRRWCYSRKYKISLDSNYRAHFFSSLDMSLVLYSMDHDATKITLFIFASCSRNKLALWLFFLQNSIQRDRVVPENLSIRIPELEIDVGLPADSFLEAAEEDARLYAKTEILNAVHEKSRQVPADFVTYGEIRDPVAQPTQAGHDILNRIYSALETVAKPADIQEAWNQRAKFGMAWRRFDRLKWMDNRSLLDIITAWSMLDSHRMEFRRLQDNTSIRLPDGTEMEEPEALEGFCWRVKAMKASTKKNLMPKRAYLHSHGHLLMLSDTRKVILPLIKYQGKAIVTADEDYLRLIWEDLPKLHKIDPYGLSKNGDFQWLSKCRNLEDFDLWDGMAQYEAERRAQIVATAHTAFDLRIAHSVEPLLHPEMFQITYDGGNHVWLRVPSKEARDHWVKELSLLVKFWRARHVIDSRRVQDVNRANMDRFDMPAEMVGQTVAEWESDAAKVDELSYLPYPQRLGLSVIYSGYIFQKTAKFKTFRCYYAILTPQVLILMKVKYRPAANATGAQRAKERCTYYYRHAQVVSLRRCYVFSGLLSADYLLEGNQRYVDKENPGVEALPRAWPDGWHSPDTMTDRCFVIWAAQRHSKAESVVGNPNIKQPKFVSQRMVCLARSRFERDLWVSSLQDVLTEITSDISRPTR